MMVLGGIQLLCLPPSWQFSGTDGGSLGQGFLVDSEGEDILARRELSAPWYKEVQMSPEREGLWPFEVARSFLSYLEP